MKYNSFVNPFISCKTDIIISNDNDNATCLIHVHMYITGARAGYNTIVTMDLQFAWKSFFVGSILNSNLFVSPFSSDAYRPHNTL